MLKKLNTLRVKWRFYILKLIFKVEYVPLGVCEALVDGVDGHGVFCTYKYLCI